MIVTFLSGFNVGMAEAVSIKSVAAWRLALRYFMILANSPSATTAHYSTINTAFDIINIIIIIFTIINQPGCCFPSRCRNFSKIRPSGAMRRTVILLR